MLRKDGSYYEAYRRGKNITPDVLSRDKRMTDPTAYMTFLEVQLERVSAAFLSLKNFTSTIDGVGQATSNLEQRVTHMGAGLTACQDACEEQQRSHADAVCAVEASIERLELDVKNQEGALEARWRELLDAQRQQHSAAVRTLQESVVSLQEKNGELAAALDFVRVDSEAQYHALAAVTARLEEMSSAQQQAQEELQQRQDAQVQALEQRMQEQQRVQQQEWQQQLQQQMDLWQQQLQQQHCQDQHATVQETQLQHTIGRSRRPSTGLSGSAIVDAGTKSDNNNYVANCIASAGVAAASALPPVPADCSSASDAAAAASMYVCDTTAQDTSLDLVNVSRATAIDGIVVQSSLDMMRASHETTAAGASGVSAPHASDSPLLPRGSLLPGGPLTTEQEACYTRRSLSLGGGAADGSSDGVGTVFVGQPTSNVNSTAAAEHVPSGLRAAQQSRSAAEMMQLTSGAASATSGGGALAGGAAGGSAAATGGGRGLSGAAVEHCGSTAALENLSLKEDWREAFGALAGVVTGLHMDVAVQQRGMAQSVAALEAAIGHVKEMAQAAVHQRKHLQQQCHDNRQHGANTPPATAAPAASDALVTPIACDQDQLRALVTAEVDRCLAAFEAAATAAAAAQPQRRSSSSSAAHGGSSSRRGSQHGGSGGGGGSTSCPASDAGGGCFTNDGAEVSCGSTVPLHSGAGSSRGQGGDGNGSSGRTDDHATGSSSAVDRCGHNSGGSAARQHTAGDVGCCSVHTHERGGFGHVLVEHGRLKQQLSDFLALYAKGQEAIWHQVLQLKGTGAPANINNGRAPQLQPQPQQAAASSKRSSSRSSSRKATTAVAAGTQRTSHSGPDAMAAVVMSKFNTASDDRRKQRRPVTAAPLISAAPNGNRSCTSIQQGGLQPWVPTGSLPTRVCDRFGHADARYLARASAGSGSGLVADEGADDEAQTLDTTVTEGGSLGRGFVTARAPQASME